ncbi:rCG39728, isoform CRA_b [Rattus norvegicus]|uniref:RCG39728, isoform CRA_b n=1 Tax=Rattus norvegicus TaxID=10116 RepID=A6IA22_RAT|nr:rCG39728, isoform CRA_b [Rattus norvegicus]
MECKTLSQILLWSPAQRRRMHLHHHNDRAAACKRDHRTRSPHQWKGEIHWEYENAGG